MIEPTPPTHEKSRSSRGKVLRAVLVVMLGCGVVLGIWGMRRYDRLVETGKRIEKRFTALDERIAYDGEANAEAPADPARIEVMLAARERMMAALPDEILPSIASPDGPPGRIELGRDLLLHGEQIEPAADALADALEELEMNPREYRHLLERLVHAALYSGGAVPMGEAYREMLNRIAPNSDLNYHGLEERRVAAAHEIELARRLESANPMAPLADLMVLTVKEQKTK